MGNGEYILIADSHIQSGSAEEGEFLAMLDRIAAWRPQGVVFLGDIFELWIALPGYELPGHQKFLEWCERHKGQFEIGFIEGNHEYYITRVHGEAFTWADAAVRTTAEGVEFLHGDLINRSDLAYRLLRFLLRSALARWFLRLTAGNIGPKMADWLRRRLKNANLRHKRKLPRAHLENYARQAVKRGVRKIFAGHFHRSELLTKAGSAELELLPAWMHTGEIVRVDKELRTRCGPWRERPG